MATIFEEFAAQRERIIATLLRLVFRRRTLRRELAIESIVAGIGGIASAFAPDSSRMRAITVALAFVALVLAGLDWRRLRVVGAQIDTLARFIGPFV